METIRESRFIGMTMKKLKPIMLGGTGSDVGKSVLVAGLCRIFLQDGYQPAPFKAQNMALNSYVTPDGLEIGRAQAVQAEAARVECMAEMNPVLLKPSGNRTSQVVLNGVPVGNKDAYDYFKKENKEPLRKEVQAAFDRLSAKYNPIVMEGAGSIAELNLRDTDIVNMSMASYADATVILVADIDRGGVFASAYGSIMLQSEEDRRLIKGIIVNKFRGDEKLFETGRKLMEDICGVPVIGVVPYLDDIHIEEEDSVSLMKKSTTHTEDNKINVAVVATPHLSNFTDFDTISRDSRVHLYFTSDPEELKSADVIILPGSKNTISDLRAIRENGCAQGVIEASRCGRTVMGICGGYQMMGEEVDDPDGVEGEITSEQGLGLLPARTVLKGSKTVRRVEFTMNGCDDGGNVINEGYEIHMGETVVSPSAQSLVTKIDGEKDGCLIGDRIMGSYIHGILDNPGVIDLLLKPHAEKKGLPLKGNVEPYHKYKERQYDALAERLRGCLDIDFLYKIMREDSKGGEEE